MSDEGKKSKGPKIFSLFLYKLDFRNKAIELMKMNDGMVFPFFQRHPAKQALRAISRIVVERAEVDDGQCYEEDHTKGKIHVKVRPSRFGAVLTVSAEYPPRLAKTCVSEALAIIEQQRCDHIIEDTNLKIVEIEAIYKKYLDPSSDKLFQAQREIDETKDMMVQSMDRLMKRGEDLDGLMEKTDDLSGASYQFMKQAKKTKKSWCKIY